MKTFLACLSFVTCAIIPLSAKTETTTPIKYLVVIYQENRTFDHYFGTYPYAENNPGETPFYPRPSTPAVNGLSGALLQINQNLVQPFRLAPSQVNTCDPRHSYTSLQQAYDAGLMDMFVQVTGMRCPNPQDPMGYFDGNTVTALWNFAQYFAMSDNFHTTTIGPSTIGAINLISGQTHGALPSPTANSIVQGTMINNVEPKYDMCADLTDPIGEMTGRNVGDLLNARNITWGLFQGGFADCSQTHMGPNGPVEDYVPHHNPFQYYRSTSNPLHLPPASVDMIGYTDQANHNYDLADFWAAACNHSLPAVSYLRAPGYLNGHAGNSTPLLEQEFLVATINRLQKLPQWKDMAIIIAYDDPGGWYDHEMPPIINQSQLPQDALVAPGNAGSNPPLGGYQGRPGYGQRVPLLVISPWAKENFVDSTLTDQSSILHFIEDNWKLGRIGDYSFDAYAGSFMNMFDFCKRHDRRIFLDPSTGAIKKKCR